MKVFANFQTILTSPVIFENENFAEHVLQAHGQMRRFFGMELLKIYLIDSNVSNVENCKISA